MAEALHAVTPWAAATVPLLYQFAGAIHGLILGALAVILANASGKGSSCDRCEPKAIAPLKLEALPPPPPVEQPKDKSTAAPPAHDRADAEAATDATRPSPPPPSSTLAQPPPSAPPPAAPAAAAEPAAVAEHGAQAEDLLHEADGDEAEYGTPQNRSEHAWDSQQPSQEDDANALDQVPPSDQLIPASLPKDLSSSLYYDQVLPPHPAAALHFVPAGPPATLADAAVEPDLLGPTAAPPGQL